MKERLERVCNSFKTGVMIWIFAYLLLYAVCVYIGDFSAYNDEVMKLLNIENFIAQLLIAGAIYITLEIVLLHFVDNMLKFSEQEKNKVKNVAKSFVVSIVILVIFCSALYVIKEKNILNKNVMKLMIAIIGLKAIVFVINQIINTSKYNKKLKEK